MENNSLLLLSNELASNGIASLRYDKRGIGNSFAAGMSEKNLKFEHYISDAESWVDFLYENYDFTDIVIIGHSEGSLIGIIASQNERVSQFISIAGIARSADKILLEQLKSQSKEIFKKSVGIVNHIKNSISPILVDQNLHILFRPSVQPYLHSWFKFEPGEEISKINKPVLIIHGTTDIQVNLEEATLLENASRRSKKVIIDGMNHILKKSVGSKEDNIKTYYNSKLPLHTDLSKAIIDFITSNRHITSACKGRLRRP